MRSRPLPPAAGLPPGCAVAGALGLYLAEKRVDHDLFLYFERMGAREVLVRPDRQAPDPLMLGQLTIGPCNDLTGRVGVVQDQGRVHLDRRPSRQPHHGRIRNVRMLCQHRLDVVREDVLAAWEHDHVLHTALDMQEALVVEESQVARPVPIAVEGLGGLFRRAPVARSHVVSTHQDLSRAADLDLHVRQWTAGRVVMPFPYGVVAYHRRRLGGAVSLYDFDAEQIPFPS